MDCIKSGLYKKFGVKDFSVEDLCAKIVRDIHRVTDSIRYIG
jgi:hypothetical protein